MKHANTVLRFILIAFFVSGCQNSPKPDMSILTRLVVDSVRADAMIESLNGMTVVLIRDCFTADLPEFESLLRSELIEVGVSLAYIPTECDVSKLPGTWADGRNTGYVMPYVRMKGEAEVRQIQWAFVCGPLCGRGGAFTASWDGQNWIRTEQVVVLQ